MAYDIYLGKTLLPVTPSQINTKIKDQNKTANLINDKEINFLKEPGLTEISFDALLPSQPYPFASYLGTYLPAYYYLGIIEKLKTDKKPFQLIISRSAPNGRKLYDTNMKVSLEDYTIKEDSGDGMDVTVSLKFKQFNECRTKTVKVRDGNSQEAEIQVTENRETDNAPSAAFHTVKSGDTLWGIAKTYYGDGSKYQKIAQANSQITDPARIYPGWVLSIPKEE